MRQIPARLWALAALSGILQLLPFPIAGPVPLWRTMFAWVALVPLLSALLGYDRRGRPLSPGQSAALGYLCGILWYGGNCYWIYQTMYLYGGLPKPISLGILLLFALYLGLYHGLFGLVIGALRQTGVARNAVLVLAPFAWVAVELARARITGFPWDLLGYTQIDGLILPRLAPITGVYGLSFAVALVNSMWLIRITLPKRRSTRPLLASAAVLVVAGYVLLAHALSVPRQNAAAMTATLVQENLTVGAAHTVPTETTHTVSTEQTHTVPAETTQQLLTTFTQLSTHPSPTLLAGIPEMPDTPEVVLLHKRTLPSSPGTPQDETQKDERQNWTPQTDLIVWPEAPSGFFTSDPEFLRQMHALADSSNALLIVGSLGVEPNGAAAADRPYFLYDSATFFRPDDPAAPTRYDKIHLVPWGEYIPFKQIFSFAHKLTAGAGDMDRGTKRLIYQFNGHSYAVFVCYESIFGDEVRQFAKSGAEVLVNISDDGWYGDTGAAWQHLTMVRMRAIENHRWILRSTNTGVTAAIDPEGRVTAAAPRHVRTSLHTAFGFESSTTFYTVHGDVFAYGCTLIACVALAGGLLRRGDASSV